MKKYLPFIVSFCSTFIYAQTENKNYVTIGLGTIRHEVSTVSINGKIKGLPTFDFLPELLFTHIFNNHHTALTFGLQVPSLGTRYYVNYDSPIGPGESTSSFVYSQGGYYKFFIAYNYKILLNQHFDLNFALGPNITFSREKSSIDYTDGVGFTTGPNNTYVTGYTSYTVDKSKIFGAGLLFFTELQYKTRKNKILSLKFGYNKGFIDFKKVYMTSSLQNQFHDEATIYTFGSGFFTTLSYSFPVFKVYADKKLPK